MRKVREAKSKAEAEFLERARAWSKAKAKENTDIARISEETRDKSKFEAKARNNVNSVNRAAVEDTAKIRFSADIQKAKRERAEAETRAKVGAEIKKKADNISKAR